MPTTIALKALFVFFALLLNCQAHHEPPPIMNNGRAVYCWTEIDSDGQADIYGGDLDRMPPSGHRVPCPSPATFTR